MDKKDLKTIAARLVLEGRRRAAALSAEAEQDLRLARMMPTEDQGAHLNNARAKQQRAARTRRICGKLALAHGIGHKKTGTGRHPRPVFASAQQS